MSGTRIESLAILTESGEGKALLAEIYSGALENTFSANISNYFKYDALSGDPTAGTVIVRKFPFSKGGKLGDTAKAGTAEIIKAKEIVIRMDKSWEYIFRYAESDTKLFGVSNFVGMKAKDDALNAAKDTEEDFWLVTVQAGTKLESNAEKVSDKVDAAIVAVESTKDGKYVRGCSRDQLGIVLSPSAYTALQSDIDKIPNLQNNVTYDYFHGVRVFHCTDLPSGIDVVVAPLKRTTAQPILPLSPPCGRVQFSNDFYFGTTGIYGTECVYPELVRYIGDLTV